MLKFKWSDSDQEDLDRTLYTLWLVAFIISLFFNIAACFNFIIGYNEGVGIGTIGILVQTFLCGILHNPNKNNKEHEVTNHTVFNSEDKSTNKATNSYITLHNIFWVQIFLLFISAVIGFIIH